MSENILIGKSRKTGKWEILVDPGEGYDAHLRAYQKIARNIPVNDDYSKVLLGRVQNTSSPLTLITSDEKKTRDESLASTVNVAANAGKAADERQAKVAAEDADRRATAHENSLDDKNAMVNKIRKQTGQPLLATTRTEQDEDALRERLSKASIAPQVDAKAIAEAAAADALKTKEELLADKNKLVESVQKQSEQILSENAQAEADKNKLVESKKK